MKTSNGLLIVIGTLALGGCSHGELDRRIDEKVAQESAVTSRAQLSKESGNFIETAPGLTAEQRSKLMELRDQTRKKSDEMYVQSLQLRAVLMKDLVSSQYNEDEVELIKTRIKDLEDKRLSVTFNAIEEANQVLGHKTAGNEALMNVFFEGRGSRDSRE